MAVHSVHPTNNTCHNSKGKGLSCSKGSVRSSHTDESFLVTCPEARDTRGRRFARGTPAAPRRCTRGTRSICHVCLPLMPAAHRPATYACHLCLLPTGLFQIIALHGRARGKCLAIRHVLHTGERERERESEKCYTLLSHAPTTLASLSPPTQPTFSSTILRPTSASRRLTVTTSLLVILYCLPPANEMPQLCPALSLLESHLESHGALICT